MKKRFLSAALIGVFATAFIFSCQKDENLPYKIEKLNLPETPYNYANPAVLPEFQHVVNPAALNLTDAGATLGRVLFYDKKLSLTNNIACGSCHSQEKAFADTGKGSLGFDGGMTSRNSLAITNPLLENAFFWDLRETKLEQMVLKPIQNHIEMGMEDLDKLPGKLAKVDYYPALFEAAFGTAEVNEERIGSALAQFLRSMISLDSKWDRGEWGSTLTTQEQEGMNIFFGQGLCYQCHNGNSFNEGQGGIIDPGTGDWSTRRAANIGLEMHYTDPGLGRLEADAEGIFKVPSLRNVALTAPYMHDGRFQNLEEVVNHYNKNIEDHPNLDQRLRDWEGNPYRLNLTDQQVTSLVAFLGALTDNGFVADERFADPFAK